MPGLRTTPGAGFNAGICETLEHILSRPTPTVKILWKIFTSTYFDKLQQLIELCEQHIRKFPVTTELSSHVENL